MQIPLIHSRLNHLHSSLLSLHHQNPSIYTLCGWSALFLAIIATYTTLSKTLNILIIRFRRNATSLSSVPLLHGDDYDFTDTEEEHETTPSLSEAEEDEDSEDDATQSRSGEYFRFRGSGDGGGFLQRSSISDLFALAEMASSKSVVKLWDTIGLGLGFGFDDSDFSSGVVSGYDGDEDRRVRPVPTGKPPTPAVSCDSPALVLSAGESSSGNLAVRIWDTRIRHRMPAVIAEWGPTVGKTVGVECGGVQKVYVRDDGRYGLTVGDMRKVTSPLENVNVMDSHVDTWWPNPFLLKI